MTATEPPLTAKSERSEKSSAADKGAEGDDVAASRPASAKSGKSNKSGTGNKTGRLPSPTSDARDNPAADLRNMRRIIAEDPDWSLATVPLLVELCVKHVVENFERKYSSFLSKTTLLS